ncbi:putative C-_U-editing enzyme APOBEC-4 [Alligator mississippiensis]|uniref:putative C->U-editing enzyme APOBEC-4 n=1 Tax=Alligator mississippiensis TaxID=8496 RepID=UPI0003D0A387|nr:putative C->U-editing enzyme APOBEC-4 [Alligator mississippiensis]
MNPERETLFQEYRAKQGTLIKPYYWQTLSHSCAKCPYHIRTGEEARVPYVEFHKAFGFPYGQMTPQNKHIIFYELRNSSSMLVQKGHATNCIEYNIHPESMLFELGGYLDSVTYRYDSIGYIILYSNYSPCNEADHCCISKIYNFLTKYPDIILCIYFSQLYHTEDDFPVSAWNREALRSLASLWPHVTLHPLCGRMWYSLLCNFVSNIPEATFYYPVLPARALADQQNLYRSNTITGMKSYFMKASPQATYGNPNVFQNLQKSSFTKIASQQSASMMNGRLPPLMSQNHLVPFTNTLPPFGRKHLYSKPKNIVRHLKMPQEFSEFNDSQFFPSERPVQMIKITEKLTSSKSRDQRGQKKKESKFTSYKN